METNDSAFPLINLKAAGYVDSGVSSIPAVLDLREVASDRGARARCFVRYSGDRDEFAVTRIACTLPEAEVRCFELNDEHLIRRTMPGVGRTLQTAPGVYLVELSLKPGRREIGAIRGQIVVDTTIAQYERITIPVTGEIVPPVRALPNVVSFGEIAITQTAHQSIRLYSADNRRFSVESVKAGNEVVKFTESAQSCRLGHLVALNMNGDDALALRDGKVDVIVRLADTHEAFSIPLTIFAIDKAHRSTQGVR